MLKYLYVLVSDNDDYYLENAFLSMYSLKMRMPQAHISLLCDKDTQKTLAGVRKTILDFVNEVNVPYIDNRFNKKQRSRWLKTSMRRHITGDFLYIDSDTIIADSLEEIAEMNIDVGAVLDAHGLLKKHTTITKYQATNRRLGFDWYTKTNKQFNGGVIFAKDTSAAHAFFAKWHELWQHSNAAGCVVDQPSFNQTNCCLGGVITELDGIWNCQILFPRMLPYLYDAKIIHCFIAGISAPRFYKLADAALFEKIKETGTIAEETKELLKTPKQAFTENTIFYRIPPNSGFLLSPSFTLFNALYKIKVIKWLDVPCRLIINILGHLNIYTTK
jgi:hypothetical protein